MGRPLASYDVPWRPHHMKSIKRVCENRRYAPLALGLRRTVAQCQPAGHGARKVPGRPLVDSKSDGSKARAVHEVACLEQGRIDLVQRWIDLERSALA
jgi:hypothetical protein